MLTETRRNLCRMDRACEILMYGSARVFMLLANREREDPLGIIKTAVIKSPTATRGIRVFDEDSLHRYVAWRFNQATGGGGQ